MAAKKDTKPIIKKLWGIAKSPELKLSDEELHLVVMAHTGKDSIRELNYRELKSCIMELGKLRDSAKRKLRGGNPATENQRKKIYKLTQELGWEKAARVNGLCQKMFQVSRVEWLDYRQCSSLIEALKSMVERKKQDGNGSGEQSDIKKQRRKSVPGNSEHNV